MEPRCSKRVGLGPLALSGMACVLFRDRRERDFPTRRHAH